MNISSSYSLILILGLISCGYCDDTQTASKTSLKEWIPPSSFKEIDYVEYGGGPLIHYKAADYEKVEILLENTDYKLVWTVANPPSTATPSHVFGLFILTNEGVNLHIADSLRFEASGMYSSGEAKITSYGDDDGPHITLTIKDGGRLIGYQRSCTYQIKNRKFELDIPKPITSKSSQDK